MGKILGRSINNGLSKANLVESLRLTSSFDEDFASFSDGDFAFMVTLTVSSYAFAADSFFDIWFADSGASEHMTDRME